MIREAVLARALVQLADTLVDDFDVVDLLMTLADRCVEVLDVAAAGIMLASPSGELQVLASSDAAMRVVELFELQAQQGPCLDCYRSGQPVLDADLAVSGDRWPQFAPVALAAGYRTAGAVPMRLRGTVIGALNLFRTSAGTLGDDDLSAARALADVATIAILQHRTSADIERVNSQLVAALEGRIVIEQAKGIVAQRADVDIDEAFTRLRRYARDRDLRLADVARDVVDGTRDLDTP